MQHPLLLYRKYHIDRDDERLGLFAELAKKYEINNVLYPGSFVHVTPSFVFPRVVYVDSYREADRFFKDEAVPGFVRANKLYPQEANVVFHKADYTENFGEQEGSFDLLISQYAGFISMACKKYLKVGGLLAVNNSHGDASMASIDRDYQFIAFYNKRKDKYVLSEKDLSAYFIPKSNIEVTKAYLEKTQRGIGYTKTPSGYIFQKVR